MRKKTLLVVFCVCIFGLTGCESAVSLTDNEENVIAEYLAGVLLARDENYDQALIEPTPTPIPTAVPTQAVTATPEAEKTTEQQAASNGSSQSGNQQANADFTQVVGIDGLKIEYNGYEVSDSYESGDSYRLDANSNKSLFVVKFVIENTKDKALNLNLGKYNINYQLDLDAKKTIRPLLTYLDNDMRYLDVKIDANSKMETVIVFEVDKKLKYETANVVISKEDQTAIIKVK